MDDEEPNNSKENKDLGQSKVSDGTGWKFYIYVGSVVVLIAWYLDLQCLKKEVHSNILYVHLLLHFIIIYTLRKYNCSGLTTHSKNRAT